MAFVQRKITDFPSASSLNSSDVLPIVSFPTNTNKKISGQTLAASLATNSLPTLTSYLINNDLIVDASILNPSNFVKPVQNDAVERIRVSDPQSLIDTDFEYSLQSSKWETLQTLNNRPSLYIRSNEPSFTNEQVRGIFASTDLLVTTLTSNPVVVYADPRQTRTGPLSSGWSVVYEGGYQTNYDNYGTPYETIDATLDFNFITSNLAFPVNYFGSNIPSITFGGGMAGVHLREPGYTFYGLSITSNLNQGIYITTSGVSGTTTGGGSYAPFKRIYKRVEDVGTVNERQIYLAYGFTSDISNNYSAGIPNRNENYGYEDLKFSITFYKNIPNKISFQTLSGYNPGQNIHVTANYPYSITYNVYPPTSYAPYFNKRVYDFATVLDSNNLRINTAVTPTNLLSSGTPIVLRETTDPTNIDGSGILLRVLSQGAAGSNTPASFIVSMPRVANTSLSLSPSGFKTQYTTIYTGGFFTDSEIPIIALSGLANTTSIEVTTKSPEKFYLNQPIYILDTVNLATIDTQYGAFFINNITSPTSFTYTNANAISTYPINTNLFRSTNKLYVRPTGVALHRSTDGGVQINSGDITPNCQIIRQTRKYFRYQSGKSMLFSTGLLFKPSYDIQSVTVSPGLYTSANPFYTVTVTTDQDHGFVGTNSFISGTSISIRGLETALIPNPYNGNFIVQSILSNKSFTVSLPVSSLDVAPVDLSPGGVGKVEVSSWYDGTVRSGMFDDQNGIYFQYDGSSFGVGRRFSTTNLTGTVNPTYTSTLITGNNTKFTTQLSVGDFIILKGMAYLIDRINSDTSIQVSPSYRGPTTTLVKITKRIDEVVNQENFNLDKLDGTGPSGYTINLNKMQMIYFDYSWYGAGRIRWGVRSTDGSIVYCHEMPNNNINTEAYMRSGNLPARFEITTNSKVGKIFQTNAMEFNYTNSTNISVSATLKRSTDYINYYNLTPPVSAVITPGSTQTFTVSTNNLNTFYDYKLFDTRNIDLPIDTYGLSGSNFFRINSLTNIPLAGRLNVADEFLTYTTISTNSSPVENKLISVNRNTGNLNTVSKFNIGKYNLLSQNQNCSPALSHWGTSVLMDGKFDVDKSYLFTAINNNNLTIPTNQEIPLISIRLAPAVDSGLSSIVGIRNLINRSYLSLKSIGIITNNTLNVNVKLNSSSSLFERLSSFVNLGTGSIAQYIDHSNPLIGTTPLPTGGDTILSFYANEQTAGRQQVTVADIDSIRELSNSILGGDKPYPDGPDILTVLARANASQATARCRVSWTEAQG